MNLDENKYENLLALNEDLKGRLEEAEEIIDAIRKGEVDAIIVKKGEEPEIYTLKSADHTYRMFIEKMNDGAITLNKHGIVLYCNTSFARMLRLPLSQVIGKPFESLVPAEYGVQLRNLLTKGWVKDSKAEIVLSAGEPSLPVLLSVNKLEIDGGPSLSVLVTDLSFQKQMQAQKKAMEQKDEFISIASHELKTPVTSIKGYIQLLRFDFKHQGNAQADEMLSRAEAQVNKLTGLINDLLDVKKIETGQLQFREEVFDFNELVKEIMEESQRIWNRHIMHADFGDSCKVYGDRIKIGQVLINLIDNAAKYSPFSAKIEIKTRLTNKMVRCSVKDFGLGISRNELDKIFHRFYRVSGDKEKTFPGLGLGLYISAEIIKRHNGVIGVESEYEKGSLFYFELPSV